MHFGRAAERCNVSQPTLSVQVRKLEELLGLPLFERGNRRVMLTPAGQTIVRQARVVMAEAQRLLVLASEGRGAPLTGRLVLAAIQTLGPYLFPLILRTLRQEFPLLALALSEARTAEILEGLRNGRIDAALVSLPVPASGLTVSPLFVEPFQLACPAEHPLARGGALRATDIAGPDLLLLDEGNCLRDQTVAACGAGSAAGRHATSLETLRSMVAAGAGYTLLPALAVPSGPIRAVSRSPAASTWTGRAAPWRSPGGPATRAPRAWRIWPPSFAPTPRRAPPPAGTTACPAPASRAVTARPIRCSARRDGHSCPVPPRHFLVSSLRFLGRWAALLAASGLLAYGLDPRAFPGCPPPRAHGGGHRLRGRRREPLGAEARLPGRAGDDRLPRRPRGHRRDRGDGHGGRPPDPRRRPRHRARRRRRRLGSHPPAHPAGHDRGLGLLAGRPPPWWRCRRSTAPTRASSPSCNMSAWSRVVLSASVMARLLTDVSQAPRRRCRPPRPADDARHPRGGGLRGGSGEAPAPPGLRAHRPDAAGGGAARFRPRRHGPADSGHRPRLRHHRLVCRPALPA